MGTHSTPKIPSPFANEPFRDLSSREGRQAMDDALRSVRGTLGSYYPAVIAGREVDGASLIRSVNPARPSELIGTVASGGSDDVEVAVRAAREAFPGWRGTPPEQRSAVMFRAAEIMRGRRLELAALIVLEAGKPWAEADADVCEAIDFLEYYGREMLRLMRPLSLSRDAAELDFYFYEPRGVAVVIGPWNFPLAIPVGMVSAALVAGNTVIFKPANPTSVIGATMVGILHEAGIPPPALNFLPCPGAEVGPLLVRNAGVDLVAFTGSLEVGLSILREAAVVHPGQRSVKRVVAEMGGKNAIIVDLDADLDSAVRGVVRSAFSYAGQKCSACSRVIVHEAVYDRFVERLLDATAALVVGDPSRAETQVGPVISPDARDKILGYIQQGMHEGRLMLPLPGDESAPDGYFVRPHVFVDVSPEATIAQEEIFGPVLAVLKAASFEEALEMAQSVRYALTGGVYSRDASHLRQAYTDYRVGNLYFNRHITGALVGLQPFGGSRMSGVGSKAGGPDYLLQYLEPRTVTENVSPGLSASRSKKWLRPRSAPPSSR